MCKFRDFDKYEVFEDGRIWSYSHKKWLKYFTNKKDGYQRVVLYNNEGMRKTYLLHRVVYEAVSGEPIPKGMQINHRNEIKTDNMKTNLEIVTPKQNINYGSRTIRSAKAQINGKKSKRVGAFKDVNLVLSFPSVMEAGRNGFNYGNVAACCRGELKKYKGYTWKYI